jgi:hypothetical protein
VSKISNTITIDFYAKDQPYDFLNIKLQSQMPHHDSWLANCGQISRSSRSKNMSVLY